MDTFYCEYCNFFTTSRMKYNKHLTTEEHIKNEDIHEIGELFKLIEEKKDELKPIEKRIKIISKQYTKRVDKNKPAHDLTEMYYSETHKKYNNFYIRETLTDRINELATKHNLI